MRAIGFDSLVKLVASVATRKAAGLRQLRTRQLLHRLHEDGAQGIADRIEYLVSEENAEEGGEIPGTASISSFVAFYSDNRDLGEPLLGTTPNGELQAVWALPGQRRLVAGFLADDTVRYVYRRTVRAVSSKRFVISRQPHYNIRAHLEPVLI